MFEKTCRLWYRTLEEMDFHKNRQILEKSILQWYRSPKHFIFRVWRARDARFQAIDEYSHFSQNKVQVQYWPVGSAKNTKFTKETKKNVFFLSVWENHTYRSTPTKLKIGIFAILWPLVPDPTRRIEFRTIFKAESRLSWPIWGSSCCDIRWGGSLAICHIIICFWVLNLRDPWWLVCK